MAEAEPNTTDATPATVEPASPFAAELAAAGQAMTSTGWPLNLRLRGEAFARAGVTTDPEAMLDDDAVAAAAERVAADDKAAEEARAAEEADARALKGMKLADLQAVATAEGVPFETDANRATLINLIETARAAAANTQE